MRYPIIPLRGMVAFPQVVMHFDLGREKSINALEEAMLRDQHIFLAGQKDENTDLPTADDFYHVGTVAKVKQMLKLPGDTIRVLVEGVSRGTVEEITMEDPYFEGEIIVEAEENDGEKSEKEQALMRLVLDVYHRYLAMSEKPTGEVIRALEGVERGNRLADLIASHMNFSVEEKQKLLEAYDTCDRLEILYSLTEREVKILEIELDISKKVNRPAAASTRTT